MPQRTRRAALAAVITWMVGSVSLLVAVATPANAETFSAQTLYFDVQVGPDDDLSCRIVGDLYVPDGASATDRRPAVLMTNGFGGSKDDQGAIAARLAEEGFVALTYSGLGFGGSGCRIFLDHPDFDGKAASQLISFLAGEDDIAYADPDFTQPIEPLDVVELDAPEDPRVGMVGGSYGGQVQFATAKIDDRLDTIVPLITWNDLSYSLDPNNTDQLSAGSVTGVSTDTPGSAKMVWALAFFTLGITGDFQNMTFDDFNIDCPNFATFVCPAIATAGVTGALLPGDVDRLREASVTSYIDEITIPTLLVQGENDTLFNLNEGIATYEALKAQGTEVSMIWSQFGHSGPAAPGELDLAAPDPDAQYITGRVFDWFDRYLRDAPVDTGPEFAYFRNWVDYDGNAAPAFGTATSYPIGTCDDYYLGNGELTTDPNATGSSTASFLSAPVGSTDPLDVVGFIDGIPQPLPEVDLPGTFAQYTSQTLEENVTVVGSPVANLEVAAPTYALTQGGADLGKLVLYLKLRDVAPDGSKSLIRGLVAPVRIPDVGEPFTVTMPAIAHQFAAGHRVEYTIAAASVNYRGNTVPAPVGITSGPQQSLCLPLIDGQQLPATPDPDDQTNTDTPGTDNPGTDTPVAPTPDLPSTGEGVPVQPASEPAAAADDNRVETAADGSSLPGAGSPASQVLLLVAALLLVSGTTMWRLASWGGPPVWTKRFD